MAERSKKLWRRMLWLYSALYIYIFLLFYVPNYVFEEIGFELMGGWLDAYLIIRQISERLVSGFIPVSAGVLLYLGADGFKKGLIGAIAPAALTAIYALPYCYLYALSLGFDSIWGTLISILFTSLGCIISWLHIGIMYAVAHGASRIGAWKALGINAEGNKKNLAVFRQICNTPLPKSEINGLFDLSAPTVLGIFSAAFAEFLLKLITEIISTVTYFVSAEGKFALTEIFSILFSYFLLLTELIIYHVLCCLIGRKVDKSQKTEKISEDTKSAL